MDKEEKWENMFFLFMLAQPRAVPRGHQTCQAGTIDFMTPPPQVSSGILLLYNVLCDVGCHCLQNVSQLLPCQVLSTAVQFWVHPSCPCLNFMLLFFQNSPSASYIQRKETEKKHEPVYIELMLSINSENLIEKQTYEQTVYRFYLPISTYRLIGIGIVRIALVVDQMKYYLLYTF